MQKYLAEKGYNNVIVYCMGDTCRNNLGNWETRCVTSNRNKKDFLYYTEEDPERKKYKDLEQKFYSYAKDFGFNKLIRYEKKLGKFFPTKEFEDNSLAHNYIDEFENIAFWEQLIERLVFRDLRRQEGEDNILNMQFLQTIHNSIPSLFCLQKTFVMIRERS